MKQTVSAPAEAAQDAWTPKERHSATLVLGAAFMLLADISIVNIAAPSIQRQLHASISDVQLVIAAYQVAYASALIAGGRLGDLYGRRGMFLAGTASFTIASFCCGLAQGPGQLITFRICQGISAALLYPQIIATLQVAIAPQRRTRAFAILGAVISCATIGGPLIAGVLISLNVAGSGWRPIFLINVPVGVILVALAPRLVPAVKMPGARRLDYVGTALVVAMLFALMIPVTVGRDHGWPLWGWLAMACTPVLLLTFLTWEKRCDASGRSPLLPPRLWENPGFLMGLLLYVVFFSAVISFFLYYSIVLQYGLGYGALAAGAAMVPYAIGSTLTSLRSSRFVTRYGARSTILAGCTACAVGSALMLIPVVTAVSGYGLAWLMAPAMFVTGLGLGMVIAPLLGYVLANVRDADAGAVSGLLSTAQQIGGAAGVAIVGLAFFRGFHASLAQAGYSSLRHGLSLGILVIVVCFALAAALVTVLSHRHPEGRAHA